MTVFVPPVLVKPSDYTDLVGAAPAGVNLTRLLAAATAAVRNYCGWHVAGQTPQTFTIDGPGGQLLMLPTLMLSSVTSLTNDGTTIDPTDLEWSENGYIRTDGCWSRKFRGVVIEVVHGYDSADDLVNVVCNMVGRAATAPVGVSSQSALSQSITYMARSIQADELATLDKFRLPGLH